LVADGRIRKSESVVAVLTGHLLKDTDYTAKYHTGQLKEPEGALGSGDRPGEPRPISGAFANPPARVPATRDAILEYLKRSSSETRSR
jgi:threonine synthase